MAHSQTFRASVIGENAQGTAIVFDYCFADLLSSAVHIDMATAAGAFQTLVQATLVAALPDIYTFKKYRFACVSGPFAGEIGYVVVNPPVTGALSGTNLPNEVAISMKRNTGHSSRHDRGRVFFGPVDNTFEDLTNRDVVVDVGGLLDAVSALSVATLTVSGQTLVAVLLDSTGAFNGHNLINHSVGEVFVHRRTRRFRAGV